MELDPQAKEILNEAVASGLPPVYMISVEEARKRMRAAFIREDEKEIINEIREYSIPCPGYYLGIRSYYPKQSKKLPCLLFFHGGGWTINDVDTHDNLCRAIAREANIVVVSVNYRLAPESKYPAAIEDGYTALSWIVSNSEFLGIDHDKIAVGGDSSGATIATVLCQLSKDRMGPKIIFQWLAYPVTDYYLPGTESYIRYERGYSLNRDLMIWFWHNFLPLKIDHEDQYLFPLRAVDLKKMPPAFIMTANYDPLRDEGEAYAKKLASSGVQVKVKRYEDQMHGFLLQTHRIDNARKAFRDVVDELHKVLY